MAIWEKQFQVEETASTKALQYELGEREERNEASTTTERLTVVNLPLWSKKKIRK